MQMKKLEKMSRSNSSKNLKLGSKKLEEKSNEIKNEKRNRAQTTQSANPVARFEPDLDTFAMVGLDDIPQDIRESALHKKYGLDNMDPTLNQATRSKIVM